MDVQKKLNKLHKHFIEQGNHAAASALHAVAAAAGCEISAGRADSDSGGTGNGPPGGP